MQSVACAPRWLVRALNGGAKVIAGRELDPKLRLVERMAQSTAAPSQPNLREARAATDVMHQLFAPRREAEVATEDMHVHADGRTILVRCYQSAQPRTPDACLIYAHFGGGVVGSLETCDWFCSLLAKVSGVAVVSVDYRLAPEHRFPCGFDDVLAAYLWARQRRVGGRNAYRWVGVAGDSIGGTFAAAIAIICSQRNLPLPDYQLLIYPSLDMTGADYPSRELFRDSFPLDGGTANWFIDQYLPPDADLADARLSPGRHAAHGASTPALVVAAGHDILRDEARAYAHALQLAGGKVELLDFAGLCHGFTALASVSRDAKSACQRIALSLQ